MLFCKFCKFELACGCTVFGFNANGKVLFCRIGNTFTEQFRKFCGVFCLFKGCGLPIFGDFGIAFASGCSGHCKIHTHFGAFAVEVCAKSFDYLCRRVFCDTYNVLGRPSHFIFNDLYKLFTGCFAKRTDIGSYVRNNDFSANCASPFFHDKFLRFD